MDLGTSLSLLLARTSKMSRTVRLFVGIFPSQSTQKKLNLETKNLAKNLQTEVRILAPEVLHLTLKFIGNVDETQLNNLTRVFLEGRDKLSSAALEIREFRLFPSSRKPKVLAAALEPSLELQDIFQFFAQAFKDLEKLGQKSSFKPHITVARARRWQKENIFPIPLRIVEPIRAVSLIHSQLSSEGATYTVLSSIKLSRKIIS